MQFFFLKGEGIPDRAAGGFTRQPENSKRAHLSAPALQNTTKIPREDPQRGKKRTNFVAGQGKREILGGPGEGGPGKGGPGRAVRKGRLQKNTDFFVLLCLPRRRS